MRRRSPQRFLVLFSLLTLIIANLHALDIVFTKDGEIILGSLVGPVPDGVAYLVFGEERVLNLDSIQGTERDLAVLAERLLQVTLRDGSVLQGLIVDFDVDIGLFIDIGFGVLTLPTTAIARIVDPVTVRRYEGASFDAYSFGGVFWPVGPIAAYFGFSWQAGAGAEWAIPLLRGLYGGVQLSLTGLDYLPDATVGYFMAGVKPVVTFKYLGWQTDAGLLGRFVPYASFGAGPVYIAVSDPAAYPSSYGSITFDLTLAAGSYIRIFDGLLARLEGSASLVMQQTTPFISLGVNLAIAYER